MGLLDRLLGRPTRRGFAIEVLAALRSMDAQHSYEFDAGQFRILANGGDGDGENDDRGIMNLTNIYAEYCRMPRHERAAFVRRNCAILASPKEIPDDFEDARPDLLPTLRTASFADAAFAADAPRGKLRGMPSIPLSEHLSVYFVYDLPHAMQFVTDESFARWDTPAYQAYEFSLQNLRELPPLSMAAIDDRLYVIQGGDAYVATRMIDRDRMRTLSLRGAPVAMPVTRDCLIVTGTDDAEMWPAMAQLAEQMRSEARPLCTVAHALDGDEWRPWLPPADNAAHEAFRRLAIDHIGGDYADQQDRLERRFQAEGRDVFVGAYSAAERDGRSISYTTWTNGVPTWLPKADLVAFVDPETDQVCMAPWQRVLDVVGDRMQPMDVQPPRWFVESFPDDDERNRLGNVL